MLPKLRIGEIVVQFACYSGVTNVGDIAEEVVPTFGRAGKPPLGIIPILYGS
jgi:hypothetical protein